MNEVPLPPSEADLNVDFSAEITNGFAEWAHGSKGPPWGKYLAVIRRCHAAEVERDRLRMACDIFGDLIAIHIAENAEHDHLRERAERAEDALKAEMIRREKAEAELAKSEATCRILAADAMFAKKGAS